MTLELILGKSIDYYEFVDAVTYSAKEMGWRVDYDKFKFESNVIKKKDGRLISYHDFSIYGIILPKISLQIESSTGKKEFSSLGVDIHYVSEYKMTRFIKKLFNKLNVQGAENGYKSDA